MIGEPHFDVAKLKREIIARTGPGKGASRRGLSLLATGGKNPDLVRDLISRGQDRKVTYETVAGLATAMGMTVAEFLVSAPVPLERIQVIGAVEAGVWKEQHQWAEEDWYWIDTDPPAIPNVARFALEVHGYSMDRVIPPGSLVHCLRVYPGGSVHPVDGDIVVVERHRSGLVETTCKRLSLRANGEFVLTAESYRGEFSEPIVVGKPDADAYSDDETRIVGLVERASVDLFRKRRKAANT